MTTINSLPPLSKMTVAEKKNLCDQGSWETEDSSSQFSGRVNLVPSPSSPALAFLHPLSCLPRLQVLQRLTFKLSAGFLSAAGLDLIWGLQEHQ